MVCETVPSGHRAGWNGVEDTAEALGKVHLSSHPNSTVDRTLTLPNLLKFQFPSL